MAAAAKTVAKVAAKSAVKKAGGKAAKYLGVVGRKDMSTADPDDLVIVDTPGHPLYQPARNIKPLEEWMVLSIMANGVIQAIKVVRGPMVKGRWTLEVVYGRQRVRHAREANKRLRAAGLPTIMIEVIIIDRSPEQLRMMVEIENTHRTDYTPYELATTAAESLARGASEEAVCNRSFKGDKVLMRRHLDLLRCCPEVQRAVIDGDLNFKAIDSLVKLSLEEQAAEVSKLQAAGLSGPREVRARLIEDHPDMAPANPADEEGEDGEGEEEAPKVKPVRARNAAEIAARLAEMNPFGIDAWAAKHEIEIHGETAMERLKSALIQSIPVQYRSEVESLLISEIRTARIEELKWALRDDDALVTATEHDLGGWAKPRDTKAERAAESAAKKEAEKAEKAAAKERAKADKAAEREAAKQQAKADKIAARAAAKQAAKDAKEAEKARVQAEKEAAAAKRAANKQSKASAAKQVTIEAAIAPKVNARQGAQGRGKGRGRK